MAFFYLWSFNSGRCVSTYFREEGEKSCEKISNGELDEEVVHPRHLNNQLSHLRYQLSDKSYIRGTWKDMIFQIKVWLGSSLTSEQPGIRYQTNVSTKFSVEMSKGPAKYQCHCITGDVWFQTEVEEDILNRFKMLDISKKI